MGPNKEYIKMRFSLGDAYVKKNRLKDIKKVDAVIFDCDGVLIDVRESYDKAIAKTVKWIFEAITGRTFTEELISDEIIFFFRRSGGFNDDCDIVYGALMFLLCELPIKFLEDLAEVIKSVRGEGGLSRLINTMRGKLHLEDVDWNVYALYDKLKEFTFMLDETGISSVDRAILSSKNIPEEIYASLKNLLYGSKRVGESLITTVFEEIFYGREIFKRVYNIEPIVLHSLGTINNSSVIIKPETLERLSSLIGGAKFGIASGSKISSTRYVLGSILDLFEQRALVFSDDVERVEDEYSSRGFLKVSLKKPNPYSLFRSAWSLEPFRMALYVGDSIEDALAVNKANMLDPRYMFAGVYAYTGAKDKALEEFLKFGCDIISPSVNEIPLIIETVRGIRVEGDRIL
ncbi:MAG: hypothetical protein QW424_06900 [Candidatus Bathyarchaeia archaeon]